MRILLGLCCLLSTTLSFAQELRLDYYLPDIEYDRDVPRPDEVFGFVPGKWHLSHDKVVEYARAVAAASDRVTVETYAHSYEDRPLLLLTITSEKNQGRIETIRREHVALTDAGSKQSVRKDMPVVVYQGFSVHGNEASGGNAAPLLLYYLAAGQSAEVQKILDEAVVLLDPVYNPDGFQRFSTWVNMHKSTKAMVSDPRSREFSEVWPGGRTNHYWFDLNRDWLPVQHPESRGRIRNFHKWKPNILTDHHEMGSNRSFFFQPGIPSRTNPLTPQMNQDLTGRIGEFHAAALDRIGSTYYTKESFDDYYYGKGSTYPDVNGAIGILFEQASSRGHLQMTENGELSFPFTIRNQFTTTLSTLDAAIAMRGDLLSYQQKFFKDADQEARNGSVLGYVVSAPTDQGRMRHFLDILDVHDIAAYRLNGNLSAGGRYFSSQNSFVVPLNQPQGRLVRAMFQTQTSFNDSLFYDVSAWNFGHSFNLNFAELDNLKKQGDRVTVADVKPAAQSVDTEAYAWLIPWQDYYAPAALYKLQQLGVRARVATEPFSVPGQPGGFAAGTILVVRQAQYDVNQQALADTLRSIAAMVPIVSLGGGSSEVGPFLGSPKFTALDMPKVLLLAGPGVRSYDAGEVWHLLDRRFEMPVSMVEPGNFGRLDLNNYNVIVMVSGSYGDLDEKDVEKMKDWLRSGNTLITMRSAVNWAKSKGLVNVKFKKDTAATPPDDERKPYTQRSADSGARVVGGAIFRTHMDLTHPLAYGYTQPELPVFRNTRTFLEVTKNDYATPIVYTEQPLLAGYISRDNLNTLRGSAAVVVAGMGSGKIVVMPDNPNFRAFWFGTNKLFMNAVFFGQTISSAATER